VSQYLAKSKPISYQILSNPVLPLWWSLGENSSKIADFSPFLMKIERK